MIEQIKTRIKELETAIQDLITKHTAWTAQLAEAKYLLEMAEKVSHEVAPESCVTHAIEAVDNIVDAITE